MRLSTFVETTDPLIKQRIMAWAGKHDLFCILNSNSGKRSFTDPYTRVDFMAAIGSVRLESGSGLQESVEVNMKTGTVFDSLKILHEQTNDWLFGFLTYDLKNEIHQLTSEHKDVHEYPLAHFFQPRFVLTIAGQQIKIEYLDDLDSEFSIRQVMDEIRRTEINDQAMTGIDVVQKVSKDEYLATVDKIKQHIRRGDVYEMNYCVEFYSETASIDPLSVYHSLNELSPMPFSCLFRANDHYLLCASPERFLAKRGNKIISQPIKGTAKRGMNQEEDERIKTALKNDPKEQAENVMIVDLVRNDLSRTAKKGSVKVDELFGVYTFPQLHQMISTVVSEKKDTVDFTEVIQHAFPMGSMTGAPKIRAMQLIDQFEATKRGLYSGSVGYISPEGDFDFNVVIRSILYHSKKNYVSFMVGSAITSESIGENEYNECLLKAKALFSVLNHSQPQIVTN